MKYIAMVLVSLVFLSGCGQSKIINNIERKPVGLITMNAQQIKSTYSKNISYDVCWGNVFWGVILCETIIAPIYFFGFSMFNPIDTIKN